MTAGRAAFPLPAGRELCLTAAEGPGHKAEPCLFPPQGARLRAEEDSKKANEMHPTGVGRIDQSGGSKVREDRKPGKRVSFLQVEINNPTQGK